MSLPELDNLVRIGKLKQEAPSQIEFDSLIRSGQLRLEDARNKSNSLEGRFDLAYNAAHALCLAALRWHGYRPENRYVVFQTLPHTLGTETAVWRTLAKCHQHRNVAEYEGHIDIDEQLLNDLVACAKNVYSSVSKLGPVSISQ